MVEQASQPPGTKKPIYTRLADNEIRLAVLRPNADFDELIIVDLVTAIWPPRLPYEALSYVWGDAVAQSTILIESVGGPPRPCSVTTNLGAALRHLRREGRDRPMWIDALCIDQGNVEEKEQQVSKMDQIYQTAHNVCVWLGPGSDVSDRAMAAVPKILRSIWRNKRLSGQDWELFAQLLQREWFSRRWVVQEIALAKAATVRCGRKVVSWADFSDAISLYVSRQANTWSSVTTALVASELGASTLSSMSDNALRKDAQGNIVERRWPIEDLLALLPMFQAQVPHDTIYAILSVASDSDALPPVDYGKSHAELFTEVFQHIAESSKSLDMMFRPWAPEIPGAKLPSFIMPASRRTHILGADGLHERRNADGLVGAPRRRIYTATPHLTTSPVLTELPEAKGCPPASAKQPLLLDPLSGWKPRVTLPTRGVVCAVIAEVSSVCENGTIPQDWLEAWRDQGQPQPDIWRVLVAGRSRDGAAAPNWYRRAFDNLVAHGNSSSGLGLNLSDMIKESPSSTMAEFLCRVSACTWGRRYLVSTRDKPGFFGLVPREAAPGDMICLLEGCSVPVVFRGKPVKEWVVQALQAVLPRYLESESLKAHMKERIAESLQDDVFDDREGWFEDFLKRIKDSLPWSYGGKPALWAEPFEDELEDNEPCDVAELTDSLVRTLPPLPESECEDKFRQLFERRIRRSGVRCLAEGVVAELMLELRLSTQAKDKMRASALKRFFRGLMRASLGHPSSAVLLPELSVRPQDPSWADALLRQRFRPWVERAFEQAAEQTCRHEAERVLMPPDLGFEVDADYPRILHARDRAFDQVVKSKARTPILAAWMVAADELWPDSEELGIGTWERPLQDAVETWSETMLGDPAAYGGEIVGECYVQGLMDGEWWNAGSTKEQEKRTFVIG